MRKGACKHCNGILSPNGKACEQSINIRNLVGGDDYGWVRRAPCLLSHKTDIKCDKYEEPTDEEIKTDEAEWDKVIENITKSGPFIKKIKAENPDGGSGTDECPVCKGVLHWAISSYNGHARGACETADCLKWIE